MSDPINPHHPPGHKPPGPPEDAQGAKNPPPSYGKMTAKPMTFLGMHFTGQEAEKLWNMMIRQISSQIQKDQARALKALRKLRNSTNGSND